MKKYLSITLAIVSIALVTFLVATILLFSRRLENQRQFIHQRMLSSARFAVDHLENEIQTSTDSSHTGYVNEWLHQICGAVGFERIVLTDTLGLVYWSSQFLIERGDDFYPYLIDTLLFVRAFREQKPVFTRSSKIEDVHFKSLYFPCFIGRNYYLAVVEANQTYFSAARLFRKNILFISSVMCVILALLAITLSMVNSQAVKAMQKARKNEQLAFLGRTSAELAHELKNPLAIIKSSGDVLQKKYDPEKKERAFTFLSDEIMRLSRLITDILSFSREKKLLREPFLLQETIDVAIHSLSQHIPEVEVSSAGLKSIHLIGDRDVFIQICGNLFRNAAAAMNGTGSISVSVAYPDRQLALSFSDTGPGIPKAIAGHLFDPFVSGSKSGTGLGLAIVKTLCDSSGWNIKITSGQGSKTQFTIYIPEGLWQES